MKSTTPKSHNYPPSLYKFLPCPNRTTVSAAQVISISLFMVSRLLIQSLGCTCKGCGAHGCHANYSQHGKQNLHVWQVTAAGMSIDICFILFYLLYFLLYFTSQVSPESLLSYFLFILSPLSFSILFSRRFLRKLVRQKPDQPGNLFIAEKNVVSARRRPMFQRSANAAGSYDR